MGSYLCEKWTLCGNFKNYKNMVKIVNSIISNPNKKKFNLKQNCKILIVKSYLEKLWGHNHVHCPKIFEVSSLTLSNSIKLCQNVV